MISFDHFRLRAGETHETARNACPDPWRPTSPFMRLSREAAAWQTAYVMLTVIGLEHPLGI